MAMAMSLRYRKTFLEVVELGSLASNRSKSVPVRDDLQEVPWMRRAPNPNFTEVHLQIYANVLTCFFFKRVLGICRQLRFLFSSIEMGDVTDTNVDLW